MKRPAICDVPGCGAGRKRGHRLCDGCYGRLPGDIRVGINEAHHQRRTGDWNALRGRAAAFFNRVRDLPSLKEPIRREVTPEQAFALNQRLMGER